MLFSTGYLPVERVAYCFYLLFGFYFICRLALSLNQLLITFKLHSKRAHTPNTHPCTPSHTPCEHAPVHICDETIESLSAF